MFYDEFIDLGYLLRPLGNVVYIMPHYIFAEEELEGTYAAIEKV